MLALRTTRLTGVGHFPSSAEKLDYQANHSARALALATANFHFSPGRAHGASGALLGAFRHRCKAWKPSAATSASQREREGSRLRNAVGRRLSLSRCCCCCCCCCHTQESSMRSARGAIGCRWPLRSRQRASQSRLFIAVSYCGCDKCGQAGVRPGHVSPGQVF
jgi:hypothetical protein